MTREAELGPLEMKVLGLLGTESMAVADLQRALAKAQHELAYTTVMTVLVRLHEKGLVKRSKEGRRYVYAAARGAPKVKRGIVERIQRTLFKNDRTAPILALIEDEAISEAELRALRRAIDDKLKDRT